MLEMNKSQIRRTKFKIGEMRNRHWQIHPSLHPSLKKGPKYINRLRTLWAGRMSAKSALRLHKILLPRKEAVGVRTITTSTHLREGASAAKAGSCGDMLSWSGSD